MFTIVGNCFEMGKLFAKITQNYILLIYKAF
jgi:hypothetical protein